MGGWGTLPLSPDTPRETQVLEVEEGRGGPPIFAGGVGRGSVHKKIKPGGRGVPGILEGWGEGRDVEGNLVLMGWDALMGSAARGYYLAEQ